MDAYPNWLLSQVQRIEPGGDGPCHQVKKDAEDLEGRWADAGFVDLDLPLAAKSTKCNPWLVFPIGWGGVYNVISAPAIQHSVY